MVEKMREGVRSEKQVCLDKESGKYTKGEYQRSVVVKGVRAERQKTKNEKGECHKSGGR